MSKLHEILTTSEDVQEEIFRVKALMLELVDETVTGLGGDVPYGELREKINNL